LVKNLNKLMNKILALLCYVELFLNKGNIFMMKNDFDQKKL